MISRTAQLQVESALDRQAAVALIGPRQVGKTTLAHAVAVGRSSVILDLESLTDREKLSDPEFFLRRHSKDLVVLDEIHRMPELFQVLRILIDEGRREGHRTGRFLVLGSAGIELLGQFGWACRICEPHAAPHLGIAGEGGLGASLVARRVSG